MQLPTFVRRAIAYLLIFLLCAYIFYWWGEDIIANLPFILIGAIGLYLGYREVRKKSA